MTNATYEVNDGQRIEPRLTIRDLIASFPLHVSLKAKRLGVGGQFQWLEFTIRCTRRIEDEG